MGYECTNTTTADPHRGLVKNTVTHCRRMITYLPLWWIRFISRLLSAKDLSWGMCVQRLSIIFLGFLEPVRFKARASDTKASVCPSLPVLEASVPGLNSRHWVPSIYCRFLPKPSPISHMPSGPCCLACVLLCACAPVCWHFVQIWRTIEMHLLLQFFFLLFMRKWQLNGWQNIFRVNMNKVEFNCNLLCSYRVEG